MLFVEASRAIRARRKLAWGLQPRKPRLTGCLSVDQPVDELQQQPRLGEVAPVRELLGLDRVEGDPQEDEARVMIVWLLLGAVDRQAGAHNPLVPGSSPGGPTKCFKGLGFYAGRPGDWNPLASA
jgi:hypothetical protein